MYPLYREIFDLILNRFVEMPIPTKITKIIEIKSPTSEAETHRKVHQMLKHIVLSQKNADRNKKCMQTATCSAAHVDNTQTHVLTMTHFRAAEYQLSNSGHRLT